MGLAKVIYAAAIKWCRVLPRPLAWHAGRGIGAFIAQCPGRDARRSRKHLAEAFPEMSASELNKRNKMIFAHFGGMMLESLARLHECPYELAQNIPVHGGENMRSFVRYCREHKIGGIFSSGHMGNWEQLAIIAGARFPTTVVGKRMRCAEVEAALTQIRCRAGNRLLHQDAGVLSCLREIRSGRFLATLPDQAVTKLAGCFVPWFGKDAWTPIGPGLLASMANAPILPAYLMRHGKNWQLFCRKMVLPDPHLPREIAASKMLAEVTLQQEKLLRLFPAQWAWWHLRYKVAPEDKPESFTVSISGAVRKTSECLDQPDPKQLVAAE